MGNCCCLPKPEPGGEKVSDWVRRKFKSKKNLKVDEIVAEVIIKSQSQEDADGNQLPVVRNQVSPSSVSLDETSTPSSTNCRCGTDDELMDISNTLGKHSYYLDIVELERRPSSPLPDDGALSTLSQDDYSNTSTRFKSPKTSKPISPLAITKDEWEKYKIQRPADNPLREMPPPKNPIFLGVAMRRMQREGIKPQIQAISRIKDDEGVAPAILIRKRADIETPPLPATSSFEKPRTPIMGVRRLTIESSTSRNTSPQPLGKNPASSKCLRYPSMYNPTSESACHIRSKNEEFTIASLARSQSQQTTQLHADIVLEEKFLKYLRAKKAAKTSPPGTAVTSITCSKLKQLNEDEVSSKATPEPEVTNASAIRRTVSWSHNIIECQHMFERRNE